MKLLHIDSAITGEQSVSRAVTAAAVARLVQEHPGLQVTHRDLVAEPVPHLTLADLANHADVDQFLAADIVVIGAPMYNFTLPSQLKAWFDRILIARKTFRYSEAGPKGLAGGKRVIAALSRGGLYGPGSPTESFEHLETYLKTIFGFIGVSDVEFVIAEGMLIGPELREAAVSGALAKARALQAARAAA